MYTYSGSLSYVTGAHRFKAGARQQQTDAAFVSFYNDQRLAYNFSNTLPVSLTMYANHGANNPFEMYTTALYAQDQWTAGRLTLQGGIRFEHIGSYYPESTFVADRFLPTPLSFPAQDAGVSPKDINPRFGAAYDVFGSGKTSLKFSLGRYPTADNSYGTYGWLQQPAFRVATSTTRNWNDATTFPVGDPRRGNYSPDCDLMNPAANGECGPWFNQNFGRPVVFQTYDPKVLERLERAEYSWDMSVGIQQEVAPRTSLEVTYVRRSWGNQTVTDNRAVGPADFDRFNLTAPVDPRLPNGGGYLRGGVLRRETREVRPGRQFHHLRQELRPGPHRNLQRRGRQPQHAAEGRPHGAGRLQRRAEQTERLRHLDAASGNPGRGFSLHPDSAVVLRPGLRLAGDGRRADHLHHPEGRRAGGRDDPEPAVRGRQFPRHRLAEPGGELAGDQRAGRSGAWAAAGRERRTGQR